MSLQIIDLFTCWTRFDVFNIFFVFIHDNYVIK